MSLPVEKESWIVCGTQSGTLLVINTEDGEKRHTLEKMTDSVTCLYCNPFPKQRCCSEFDLWEKITYLLDDWIVWKTVIASAKTAHFKHISIYLHILKGIVGGHKDVLIDQAAGVIKQISHFFRPTSPTAGVTSAPVYFFTSPHISLLFLDPFRDDFSFIHFLNINSLLCVSLKHISSLTLKLRKYPINECVSY